MMKISGLFGSHAGMALALMAPLLGGCATQASAPTVFGARILPSEVAVNSGNIRVAGGNRSAATIFGVPVMPAQRASNGTALASMP